MHWENDFGLVQTGSRIIKFIKHTKGHVGRKMNVRQNIRTDYTDVDLERFHCIYLVVL